MTSRQLEILQHALGADQYGRWPKGHSEYYRNHFCAGESDKPDCMSLVDAGFAETFEREFLPYFNISVTDEGIKAMRAASPNPPKLTRSQKRFEEYRDCHDAFGWTFREFLANIQTDWYKEMRRSA